MLAHRLCRRDPRHRGQRPGVHGGEEVAQRRNVPELLILAHGVEVRKRVPDARRLRVLRHRCAEHLAVGAVGLRALGDVVAPADVRLVQQVRQVGPRVVGYSAGRVLRLTRWRARRLHGRAAARGDVRDRALRRPAGDEVQMLGQAPGEVWLEHVVLQDEVPRVRPVVRDLVPVVVAHDVGPARRERAGRRVDLRRACGATTAGGLQHEAVHPPAGDVADRVDVVVRSARVAVRGVVVGTNAAASRRRDAEVLRQTVGAWIRPEVGVERPVLLHDHDDVPDQVDAAGRAGRARRRRGHDCSQEECSDSRPPHPPNLGPDC